MYDHCEWCGCHIYDGEEPHTVTIYDDEYDYPIGYTLICYGCWTSWYW